MNTFIKISPSDDVVVALQPLKAGQVLEIDGSKITILDDIPFGHKIALRNIAAGENIIKYGLPIGCAVSNIKIGAHIHTHNLKTKLSDIETYTYNKESPRPFKPNPRFLDAQIHAYKRKDGSVGIRNEVWIIPTVGCVNTTAQTLAKKANEKFAAQMDGFFAFTHSAGCSQTGRDQIITQKLLAGLINNPNAAAVLVLGLGCENNNRKAFEPFLGDYDKDRVKFLTVQEVEDELEEGLKILKTLAEYAASFKREPLSISNLTIGFKCGGSDAFSGITANPLCGHINDLLCSLGAKTILTETPEMFGAERLLMNRAKNEAVFGDIVSLINNFKEYFLSYKQNIYENPSPGNKDGGISSLEEKSLGCIQKGGLSQVNAVLDYGQSPKEPGLHLLNGPGNDMVSCTNLTSSGAQIILFTTGRGNPLGAPVPTVKISSSTSLFERKKHWIDFDAGIVLNEGFEKASENLFSFILQLANGELKTQNELKGYREIALFKDGVIL
jgi:altronate hydrolase